MEGLKEFLGSGYGYGSGDGSGDGSGYGSGDGSGYGYGNGNGSGDGSGYGNGSGYGSGDGNGNGDGSGNGNGDGSGYGSGSGYGNSSGYGNGYGNGNGSGDGSGYGNGIKEINSMPVVKIDDIATAVIKVRGNVLKGYILGRDMSLSPCWIVKYNNTFAHGETIRAARTALDRKLFDNLPLEERIIRFVRSHEPGREYPNEDFFDWHNKLTGSCDMGRRAFARDHNIDLAGSMTPEEFIRLTEGAYRWDIIRQLKPYYEAKQ